MREKRFPMKRVVCLALAGVGGALLCASLAAQPPAKPLPQLGKGGASAAAPPDTFSAPTLPPPPPAAPNGKQAVQWSGRSSQYDDTPQGRIFTLSKGAWFRTKDAYLTTEKALYNERTNIASSPVKLKIETQDATVTGNTGTAFFKTKDAQMRGQIVMVIRPRPEDRNAPEGSARRQFDSPATITCEKADYNWRSGKGVLTEKLVVKQKRGVVTADRLLVDTKNQLLTLDKNVVYKGANGDEATYEKVVLNYREGAKTPFVGTNGVGTSYVDEEETATPNNAPAPENAPAPAPETAPAPQQNP